MRLREWDFNNNKISKEIINTVDQTISCGTKNKNNVADVTVTIIYSNQIMR